MHVIVCLQCASKIWVHRCVKLYKNSHELERVYLVTVLLAHTVLYTSFCVSSEVLHIILSCFLCMLSVPLLHWGYGCWYFVHVFVLIGVWIWFKFVAFDFVHNYVTFDCSRECLEYLTIYSLPHYVLRFKCARTLQK